MNNIKIKSAGMFSTWILFFIMMLFSACSSMIDDGLHPAGDQPIVGDDLGDDSLFSITGRVEDHGAGVANAAVTLFNDSFVREGATDSFGMFSFNGVPAGEYYIEPRIGGYVFDPGRMRITVADKDFTNISFSRTDSHWELAKGSDYDREIMDAVATDDGGYLMAGYASNPETRRDVYLAKVSNGGSIEWEKYYGGAYDDEAFSITRAHEAGFIVAGYTCSSGKGGSDILIAQIDDSGNMTWQATFGGKNSDKAYSITVAEGGGYIVAGETRSFGAVESWDGWIINIDNQGSLIWEKVVGANADESLRDIVASNGVYYAAGYTNENETTGEDILLVRISSTGSIEWKKSFGSTGNERANSIIRYAENDLIVAGYAYPFGGSTRDAYVVRIDGNGVKLWEKHYGQADTDETITSVVRSGDNGIVFSGYMQKGLGFNDIYVSKIDGNGLSQWSKAFGGNYNDFSYVVMNTIYGGFVVAGGTRLSAEGAYHAYAKSIGADGSTE